jgi:iron(III) transport system substrate-binding protein
MNRIAKLGALVVFVWLTTGTSAIASDSAELNALYEKAKAEGNVLLAAGMPPKALRALKNGFNERFPGVTSKVIASTGSNATTRILTEAKVGNPTIGVLQSTTSSGQPLLEAGLVSSFDYSKTFGIPQKGVLFGNRFVPWFDLVYVLAYNTKLLHRDQVPTTWEGLLDPKWKDRKLVLIARGHPFQYLARAWGEEKVLEYAKKIKAQDPIMTPRGGNQVIEAIVSGQALLGPIHLNRVLTAKILKHAPIDYVWLDYTPVLSFYATAINKVAAPHAAILMAGWLATPEGGKIMEKYSFRALTNPESGSETAKLLAESKSKLVPSATDVAGAKQEKKWQNEVRKIFVSQ